MNYRIDYELKTDSIGRNYTLRRDLRTGKAKRIPYKEGEKKFKRQTTDRKRDSIKEEIKKEGIEAKYADYKRLYEQSERAIIKDRKKKGLKTLGTKGLHTKTKEYVIKEKLGLRTYFKYMWVWSEKVYYKEDNEIKFDCETGFMTSEGMALNGDHFEGFIDIVKDGYGRIPDKKDLCYLDGGACVRIYRKEDGKIIDKYQQGRGCGFFIDFKTYNYDNNLLKEQELIDL